MNIPCNFNPLGFTLAQPAGELPAGYTRLAFLANATTAAISLGTISTAGLGCELVTGPPAEDGWMIAAGMSSNTEFFVPLSSNNYNIGASNGSGNCYWGDNGALLPGAELPAGQRITTNEKITVRLNWENSGQLGMQTGDYNFSSDVTVPGLNLPFMLFSRSHNWGAGVSANDKWVGSIYTVKLARADSLIADYVPAVTPTGEPVMYDKISGADFANMRTDGSKFICGIETLNQLTALASNLPTVTGAPEIKLSLPGEWNGDAAANEQLNAINSKGWQATITYRDVETAASSSYVWGGRGDGAAARAILWCKSVASEYGNYQDENGNKYYIETCNDIWRSDGLSPDDLGYSAALDLASYLAENNLIPVEYTEEELNA